LSLSSCLPLIPTSCRRNPARFRHYPEGVCTVQRRAPSRRGCVPPLKWPYVPIVCNSHHKALSTCLRGHTNSSQLATAVRKVVHSSAGPAQQLSAVHHRNLSTETLRQSVLLVKRRLSDGSWQNMIPGLTGFTVNRFSRVALGQLVKNGFSRKYERFPTSRGFARAAFVSTRRRTVRRPSSRSSVARLFCRFGPLEMASGEFTFGSRFAAPVILPLDDAHPAPAWHRALVVA